MSAPRGPSTPGRTERHCIRIGRPLPAHPSIFGEAGLAIHHMRRVNNLSSFRQQRIGELVLRQMRRLNDAVFQLVHFSIQANHLHFIAEGRDRETIMRRIQGLMVSFAKRLNQMLGRRGKVWADRYYRRDISTSREMNTVLRYVFGNGKKHGEIPADAIALDPYSTAWMFPHPDHRGDGWDVEIIPPKNAEHWPRPAPRTRLLKTDWITAGLLPIAGAPASRIHR